MPPRWRPWPSGGWAPDATVGWLARVLGVTGTASLGVAGGSSIGVVGAGIIGLAAAYELQRRGASVTVYERGLPGNAQSGGEGRVFRHAHEDERLVRLAREARGIWREWEREL